MLESSEISALNERLSSAGPREILAETLALMPRTTLAFSGAEDVLLLHYASKLENVPDCFVLDTGRLHRETRVYIEHVQAHYQLPFTFLEPDRVKVEEFIKKKGMHSFYKDGHEECCNIRKVEPLRIYLRGFDAWITGQRQDQSPTRRTVPIVEIDESFSTPNHRVLKINPLANTSSDEVWQHLRLLEIPYNPLHDRGFISIGCEPCTRAIGPGQHEREGRWWWEEATIKECGLHRGNLGEKS